MYCGQVLMYPEEEYVSLSQLLLSSEVGGGEYTTQEYGVPLVQVKVPVQQELSIPVVEEKEEKSTVELLKEFEAVLQDQVLTPPHSPNNSNPLYQFYPSNQEFELEELVISRVEECTRGEVNGSLGSGGYSPSSSSRSSTPECEEEKGDPSWSPSSSSAQSSPQPQYDDEEEAPAAKRRRRNARSGPYTKTSPDERKLRKKEQNKNAATKYRQKKKQEVEKILDEEKGLKSHNDDLKGKVSDLQREIKYLKSLMREVFKAKGLIK